MCAFAFHSAAGTQLTDLPRPSARSSSDELAVASACSTDPSGQVMCDWWLSKRTTLTVTSTARAPTHRALVRPKRPACRPACRVARSGVMRMVPPARLRAGVADWLVPPPLCLP
eukprot:365930-Chlamydomonas_euryale.AAC.30